MSDANRTTTQRQLPLVVETREEALHALALHPEIGGWKRLASIMRPDIEDGEKAGRWLSDALNADRREVLQDIHMRRAMRAGRAVDCHVLKHWSDADTGYQASVPDEGKPRRIVLAEQLQRLADDVTRVSAELSEIDDPMMQVGG